ncbi:MAG: hypothetical protein JO033_22005 [Acidobacteriaceae bacterium]|nr:hypothetical protein [Acidobacteriaceae bacterium]
MADCGRRLCGREGTIDKQSPRLAVFTTPADWVNAMEVIVRTSGNPLLLAKVMRQQLALVDPNLAAGRIETMDKVLDASFPAKR